MDETKCYKPSRKHTIIKVLGITALALLMLVSIAGVHILQIQRIGTKKESI
jgi:hypothetical protein